MFYKIKPQKNLQIYLSRPKNHTIYKYIKLALKFKNNYNIKQSSKKNRQLMSNLYSNLRKTPVHGKYESISLRLYLVSRAYRGGMPNPTKC